VVLGELAARCQISEMKMSRSAEGLTAQGFKRAKVDDHVLIWIYPSQYRGSDWHIHTMQAAEHRDSDAGRPCANGQHKRIMYLFIGIPLKT
jgi:hypothetical protein